MFLALITLGIKTKLCLKSLINLSRNALHMAGVGGGVFPTPLSAQIHYHMSVWCSDYFRHGVTGKEPQPQHGKTTTRISHTCKAIFHEEIGQIPYSWDGCWWLNVDFAFLFIFKNIFTPFSKYLSFFHVFFIFQIFLDYFLFEFPSSKYVPWM